jgi:integrase
LEQIDRILQAARKPRQVQFAALAFTGMRSGELQRLKPQDVDLTGGWIHIVSREGAETKTGHSRKVPIHARLRSLLSSCPKLNRPWFFTAPASRKYTDGDHHINTKHLNDELLKVLTRLGLPTGRESGFTVHSLRHSFETITVNAGIPQRVIDTWLGHRSDTSMASIYYRLSDEESQRFMKLVPFGAGQSASGAKGEKR